MRLRTERDAAGDGDFIEALAPVLSALRLDLDLDLAVMLGLAEEADRDEDRRGIGPSSAGAVVKTLVWS